jgi:hypothetical protein
VQTTIATPIEKHVQEKKMGWKNPPIEHFLASRKTRIVARGSATGNTENCQVRRDWPGPAPPMAGEAARIRSGCTVAHAKIVAMSSGEKEWVF